jgi:hypothetical protein
MAIESQVFDIIHKRIHHIHRNYDGKDNPTTVQAVQLPIYKLPNSIFENSPPAMFNGGRNAGMA